LKILWHSCAPWAASGYGTQTAIWIQKLSEMGHEVVVSSYYGLSGSATQWNGITILPGFGQNYCSTSLFEHYKALQPDLVITLGDIWVLNAGLLKQMPIAHWLPCDCRPMSTADRSVAEASGSQLIAMSKFGFDRFTSAGFDPLYVPHGIDTNLFSPSEDKSGIRKKLGLEDDSFVIGVNAANNDAIRKAAPEMLLAFAKFHSDHPDAILALHLGVHQEGGQDIEVLSENLGITDRVRVVDQYHYHAGMVSAPELVDWYRAIDVLLASSYAEGFGLPIIEAQSCGIPVVTTEASSMTELNPHGISITGEPFFNGVHQGWWIRPSVSQMVSALEQTYRQRDNVDHEKLREFAKNYDVSIVAEKYMEPVIQELGERILRR